MSARFSIRNLVGSDVDEAKMRHRRGGDIASYSDATPVPAQPTQAPAPTAQPAQPAPATPVPAQPTQAPAPTAQPAQPAPATPVPAPAPRRVTPASTPAPAAATLFEDEVFENVVNDVIIKIIERRPDLGEKLLDYLVSTIGVDLDKFLSEPNTRKVTMETLVRGQYFDELWSVIGAHRLVR